MEKEKKKKREPWRIIVFLISVAYIIFTFIQKDIISIYITMPAEKVVPLIVTTVVVSLMKVGLLAGVILGIKWIIGKVLKNEG